MQFSTNIGSQTLAKRLDVLNAEQWATVSNASHDAAGLPRLAIAVNPQSLGVSTDWQDATYRNALIQLYELGVSGGSKAGKYSAVGGYVNQNGIVDLTGYNRYNLRVKSETKKGVSSLEKQCFYHAKSGA